MRRILIGCIGVAAFVGVLLLVATQLDTYERPVPDIVPGYAEAQIDVPHRDVPLPLHIWYPPQPGGMPELVGQNGLFFGEHVLRDAALAPGAHPVVALIHGSGGNAPRLSWIAAELARRGMIVVGANHPGATSGDSDPAQLLNVPDPAMDVTAALTHVTETLGASADMKRVAVVGFSLGGATAMGLSGFRFDKDRFLTYCAENPEQADCSWTAKAGVDHAQADAEMYQQDMSDPRIGVTVLVDPAQVPALGDEAGADHPLLAINLGGPNVPLAVSARPVADRVAGARYYAVDGPHDHFSFLAECATLGWIVIGVVGEENICADTGAKPRAEIHAEMKAVIGDFLTDALRPGGEGQ